MLTDILEKVVINVSKGLACKAHALTLYSMQVSMFSG